MSKSREQIRVILDRPQERPLRAVGRSLATGAVTAGILLLAQYRSGFFEWASPAAYLIAGFSIALCNWGADRLWFSTVGGMFPKPFSFPAYCSRVPFWYLAGGLAFESALLATRAAGLAGLYGIPVRQIFDTGALVGVLAGALEQAAGYPSVRRLLAGAGAPAHHHERSTTP
jgi:hypothetical protein